MRGIQKRLPDFQSRHVAVVAISVDTPEQSKKLSSSEGLQFALLGDPKAQIARQYGVLHEHAGENGADIARPAEFLVDGSQTVQWVNLTEDLRIRARAKQLLAAIDALPAGVTR